MLTLRTIVALVVIWIVLFVFMIAITAVRITMFDALSEAASIADISTTMDPWLLTISGWIQSILGLCLLGIPVAAIIISYMGNEPEEPPMWRERPYG